MHPLNLRLVLLKRLPLILSLQALGVRVSTVWVLCVDDGNGNYIPRQDYPVCFDGLIALSMERELTQKDGRKHIAVPFSMQGGGLLG